MMSILATDGKRSAVRPGFGRAGASASPGSRRPSGPPTVEPCEICRSGRDLPQGMAYFHLSLHPPEKECHLAKPNYAFAKRQRDLAKKQKREEKLKKKKTEGVETPAADVVAPAPESPKAVA